MNFAWDVCERYLNKQYAILEKNAEISTSKQYSNNNYSYAI